jgi:hypothetical protein
MDRTMAARITVSNPITGELREIEVHPGVTVREAAESSRMLPPESLYSVIDENGYIVDQDQAIDCTDTVLHLGPRVIISGGGPGDWFTIEQVILGLLGLKMLLGPFADSFMRKLGERLGDPVADAIIDRARLFRRGQAGKDRKEFVIYQEDTATAFLVSEELTDEAWLALLDLDIRADGVRGNRLCWDKQTGRWRAVVRENAYWPRPRDPETHSSGADPRHGLQSMARSLTLRAVAYGSEREVGRCTVAIYPNMTLEQAVRNSKLLRGNIDDFVLRDPGGNWVNNRPASTWADTLITIVLPD